MEKIVKQGLLYDFYGELLTAHQRAVYEDLVLHDMSLGEIAEEHGITRQAVFDLIRRCDRLLSGYEERLGLVEKFRHTREYVSEIKRLAGACRESGDITMVDEISAISDKILELV
ncbi:MAG: DNA-binding protein [Clostridium sp.]|nr:DNA-binding protein [Clostridium sp.]MBP3216505.1 DNA-binding protein [Clostridium sp.]MBQ5420897.1 DNA-binding protein [Clostridium sp.]HAE80751.1 DNA-binding protein [Lachnoclostridium sp.]